jgi:hypothetical protein
MATNNVFKVTDLVAKESLRIAHEKLQFIGTVDRQYDESFTTGRASPHGSTLRVKSPNQYTRRVGATSWPCRTRPNRRRPSPSPR